MALSLCIKLQSSLKSSVLSKCRLLAVVPRVHVRSFSFNHKSAQFLNLQRRTVTFTRTYFKFFSKPSPAKLKATDGIPEEYQLIYRNTMHRYLLSAQVFSTLSAAIVCIVAVYSGLEFNTLDTTQWREDGPKATENESFVYTAVFITLCVILQLMVSKMPIRIYSFLPREKYVFVFYGNLPMTKKRLACKVNDVIKLEERGLLPWKDSRYEIRNKRTIIMLENFFRRPADLSIMLGYQKPPEDYN